MASSNLRLLSNTAKACGSGFIGIGRTLRSTALPTCERAVKSGRYVFGVHQLHTSPTSQQKKVTTSSIGALVEEDLPRVRGIDLLRDPRLNKGMAFSLKERQILGIHGLLPSVVFSQDEQVKRITANILHWGDDLDKYVYLTALQDRNEKLFYRILTENIEALSPIVYTPTVGLACQHFGFLFRRPRGLYITINDFGHIEDMLQNWPEKDVRVIVVTDGNRILGLGDLGAFGMGIPIGKLSLYTAMGGVPPHQCLPITLDVGTDNDELLENPIYTGLRHKRVRGQRYDDFMDEFVEAVVKRFGQDTLIQFEDFANHNAFRLLSRYKDKYLTFNDDIQGTASVAVAGLLAGIRVTGKKLSEQTYLFLGAGEAACGIAHLLKSGMEEEGLTPEQAASHIWLVDINGLLTKDRPNGPITKEQAIFVKDHKHMTNLEEICREIKPGVAVGVAAATGAFTPTFLQDMASFNETPLIFALSNPTSKAECTAEEAYTHTDGRCYFASGSPFDPVTYNGKTYYPGQGNNSYIFPGVGLGAIVSGAYYLTDNTFLTASRALAEMVTDEDLARGSLYPPLSNIREVSTRLATRIVEYAYAKGRAAVYPEPADKEEFVKQHQYNTDYDSFVPPTWSWPGQE